jgi:glycosyltransferase involved in cell wall biosynthesis
MKILYIADGHSPIALNWISYFIQAGHEVHLASSFPCPPIPGLASFTIIPLALSGVYGKSDVGSKGRRHLVRQVMPVTLRTKIRQFVAPLSFPRATNSLCDVINRSQPDLIHAMRIPFEGMVASKAYKRRIEIGGYVKRSPLLISVWGNDFTLHARSTPIMAYHTRNTLQRCDALHTDCQRDLKLAREMGFTSTKPSIILPAGGGVKMDVFHPLENQNQNGGNHIGADKHVITIINPRGFRAYVRNDTFFHSIPLVLEKYPEVRFICTAMKGEAQAQKWIKELGIDGKVELLPHQTQEEMADLFRRSQISLSITTHDGTPNTLLEAMACGCFPIAGDIESLREWINPGINGLLVDPDDPKALATAMNDVITQPGLRKQAREQNVRMVQEKVEYHKVMGAAEDFYMKLLLK